MRINSVVKSSQYNLHRELSRKNENNPRRRVNNQGTSFSDILDQIKKNDVELRNSAWNSRI